MADNLIVKHGGFRKLKSFQLARLIFDLTVRFCDKFISRYSRTKDQMVQAARSGVQNIAEGSHASATSKKTELQLTNVARSSLVELLLDYEDYLRQNNLRKWDLNDSIRQKFIKQRFETANDFVLWVKNNHDLTPLSEVAANGILHLITIATRLLEKQIQSQADSFQQDGGFTERLYKTRKSKLTK